MFIILTIWSTMTLMAQGVAQVPDGGDYECEHFQACYSKSHKHFPDLSTYDKLY